MNILAKSKTFCLHGRPVVGFASCALCNAAINALAVARLADRKKALAKVAA